MANEINSPLDHRRAHNYGLTLYADVFVQGGAQQGSTVTLTEGDNAYYYGDFDLSAVPDGEYSVICYTTTRQKSSGKLYVRDNVEVSQYEFEKKTEADTRQTALIAEHDATQATLVSLEANLTALINLIETKAEADTRQTALIAEHDATQVDIAASEAAIIAEITSLIDSTPQDVYDLFTSGTNPDPFKVTGNSTAQELKRLRNIINRERKKR